MLSPIRHQQHELLIHLNIKINLPDETIHNHSLQIHLERQSQPINLQKYIYHWKPNAVICLY